MANLLKRDTEDIIWSVLSSFGFSEEENADRKRSFCILKEEVIINGGTTNYAKAEVVAAVIETVFAAGENGFKINLSDKEIFEILILFGFGNILELKKDLKDGFSVNSKGIQIASGNFEDGKSTAKISIPMLLKILESKGEESEREVSKSLAFAEKNAEGLCYDVCYNLRVNGCIVEYYTEVGDIKSAEEYAKKEGHSCILRCYPDGKLDIKDMEKDEITSTTVADFLGYCEESEDCHDHDCDCGHEHHNENCDCGHYHK